MLTEVEFRTRIASEIRSWVGTPFHMNACLKGVGVDCARLIVGVYRDIGVINLSDGSGHLVSWDWFHHSGEERYLSEVLRFSKKIAEGMAYPTSVASSGCIVLVRSPGSRIYNHAGLVSEWPRIVHAVFPRVEEVSMFRSLMWLHREIAILDPWPVYEERHREATQ